MPSPVSAVLAPRHDRDADHRRRDVDHNFLPDFARAAAGGAAVAACLVLLLLIVSRDGGLPISAYARELAGAFLAGFLVVLVARSLSARSH